MDKQEKVHIIMQIASGRVNLKDLLPKKMRLHIDGPQLITTRYINDTLVSKEMFQAQYNKQFDKGDKRTHLQIIIDGIDFEDPEFRQKIDAKGIECWI